MIAKSAVFCTVGEARELTGTNHIQVRFGKGSAAGTAEYPLTDVLRRAAKQLLALAVEAEIAAWLTARSDQPHANGHRQVVRSGYAQLAFRSTPIISMALSAQDGAAGGRS
jgi:hypothetical protein